MSPVQKNNLVKNVSKLANVSGTAKKTASSGGNFLVLLIAIILVAVVALLLVDLAVLIALFAISVVGILISMAMVKPDLTPEDELRKQTIEQYQVPETRAALLKFAIEATQKIRPVSAFGKIFSADAKRQIWLNEIWVNKCKKVYTTARFSMKDDSKSLSEIAQLMSEAGVKI